jgi:hypothetical protein
MKIVFTSCMDAIQVPQQPIWDQIAREKPDVLMLLGDQIYMDWGISRGKRRACMDLVNRNLRSDQEGLALYAQDMYQRYAAQWSVSNFQALMKKMANNENKIFVCWDDHDFAWNNSNGLGNGKKQDDAVVPWQVKHVTRVLFQQFVAQLKNPYASADYPDFPLNFPLKAELEAEVMQQPGIEEIGLPLRQGIEFGLLDERWYRYPRSQIANNAHPLLGEYQWKKLAALMKKNAKLTILAGGLPMKHKYFASHQAWGPADGGDQSFYPEYDDLLAATKSPTIYLGGDIHKNEFAGYLRNSQGAKNKHLLHICSSGAAIPSQFFVKFEPSYGVLKIDNLGSEIDVQLWQLGNDGWETDLNQVLSYGSDGWKSAKPGYTIPSDTDLSQHSTPFLDEIDPSVTDLSVICRRARLKPYRFKETKVRFDEIDALFSDDDLSEFEQSGSASQQAGSGRSFSLNIRASNKTIEFLSDTAAKPAIQDIVDRAFDRALAKNQAVVLFIHGFNNSFSESVDSAYALRSLYNVEPILLSWPSGYAASYLDTGDAATRAISNAKAIQSCLIEILERFSFLSKQEAYKGIKKIVLARSYGAFALECLFTENANIRLQAIEKLESVHSIVLSQPAIAKERLDKWLPSIPSVPIHITVNKRDSALKWAYRAYHKVWDAVGSHLPDPADPSYNKVSYFDCTNFSGVNTLHNFITRTPCSDIGSLHQLLLSGTWDNSTAPQGFKNAAGAHKVWTSLL